MSQLVGVQRICGLLDRGEIDRVEFLVQLTHRMAAEIGCSRAAVRLLIHSDEGPALRTIAMHDAASGQPVRVPDMTGGDSAPYFDALLHDGSVVVPDVAATPALAAFMPRYLGPQDVRSLLDVGFSVNGVLYGTFSCEQVGAPQHWTPRQLRLLRRIAARASLSLLQAVTATVDTNPGALWDSSSPNRLTTMTMSLEDDKEHH